jgi:pimeloyl-ACP methyl ester carboxylesterase
MSTRALPATTDRVTRALLQLRGYRSRHVRTSVGRVHALEASGSGPRSTLVLLHGFGAAAADFGTLLLHVRPAFRRIVVPDLPAHGFSDSPVAGMRGDALERGLVESLDALLDEPAVVFGNSMGGVGAIRYALARPERVAGLVLCSPGGAAMSDEQLRAFVRTFRLETHADAVAFIDRLLARPSRLRHLLAWGVRRRFGRPAMRELLASVSSSDLLRPEQLRSLSMPVLLLWGRSERILPSTHYRFFRRHLPRHARVETPPDFGHSPFLDDPRALAHHLAAFVESLDRLELAG